MVAYMNESRAKTLAVMVAILAAPKLQDVPGDSDLERRDIVYRAILHAETILGMIDRRWLSDGQHMTSRSD
jgi:hypothetical protein